MSERRRPAGAGWLGALPGTEARDRRFHAAKSLETVALVSVFAGQRHGRLLAGVYGHRVGMGGHLVMSFK